MIYLVSARQELFDSDEYKIITVRESLDIIKDWKIFQFDTETSGKCPFICKLLSAQIGNIEGTIQIVIDCTTIDIKLYKSKLEESMLVGHNLKFDLQFLYTQGIIPRKVYDTMIVEQLLYLNYPHAVKKYSLKDVARERLGIEIDKSVRGEIIWRGLDSRVILYAASDVKILGDIMKSQVKECKEKECLVGAKLECDFVPVIAYLEWCGIKLDEDRWKEKMRKDNERLDKALKELNDYLYAIKPEYFTIDRQGDLFLGFSMEPKCTVNWDSSSQVVKVFQDLGFNTTVTDKETGLDKDSVLEKVLTVQKGIEDKFLSLYLEYKGAGKVVSTYGQGHLNSINPLTGRLSTNYWQLGAGSSRMSSGGGYNEDIAKYKGLPIKSCPNVNMQQLPHDKETRACFVAEPGNLFCSCDYSAAEARMGAEVYNEKVLLDEFLYGSGDTHSAYAKLVFAKELEGVEVKDIKKKRPDLRSKVKAVEFN